MTQRGPRFDCFTLSDVGSGRLFRHDGPLVLERLDGDRWIEINRYGTAAEAVKGLDEEMGNGTLADHLRLRPVPRR